MSYHLPGVPKPSLKTAGRNALIGAGVIKPPIKRPRKGGYKVIRKDGILRKEIVTALRKKGFETRRLEPNFNGKWGLADLLVWSSDRGVMTFLEIKTPTDYMSKDQLEFQESCLKCKVNYYVIRSVEEALDIMRLL